MVFTTCKGFLNFHKFFLCILIYVWIIIHLHTQMKLNNFLLLFSVAHQWELLKYLTTAVLMPCHQRTLLIQKHVTIHIRKFVMNAMASPVYRMSYRKQLVAMRLTSLIMTRKMTFNIQLQRYFNQNIKSIFDFTGIITYLVVEWTSMGWYLGSRFHPVPGHSVIRYRLYPTDDHFDIYHLKKFVIVSLLPPEVCLLWRQINNGNKVMSQYAYNSFEGNSL